MIYLKLFFTFLKIGAFTFGGGYAMLPFIQQEVIKNNWISKEELVDFVAISESTPGPFAINISTYVGSQTGGILGSVCATLGVVLPSFVIILMVAKAYEKFSKSELVNGAMLGLKGAVVGLIGAAVVSTGRTVFSLASISGELILELVLFAAIFVALIKKVNPIIMILISAILGIVLKPLVS